MMLLTDDRPIHKLATLATIATLTLGLAACSGNTSDDAAANDAAATGQSTQEPAPAAEEPTTETRAAEPAAEPTDADSSADEGATKLILNGEATDLTGTEVSCADLGETRAISVTGSSPQQEIGLALSFEDNPPSVLTFTANDAEGNSVVFIEGSGYGSAESRIDGNTHTVSGMLIKADDMYVPDKVADIPFEFVATCK